jgi:hypothetical protein
VITRTYERRWRFGCRACEHIVRGAAMRRRTGTANDCVSWRIHDPTESSRFKPSAVEDDVSGTYADASNAAAQRSTKRAAPCPLPRRRRSPGNRRSGVRRHGSAGVRRR